MRPCSGVARSSLRPPWGRPPALFGHSGGFLRRGSPPLRSGTLRRPLRAGPPAAASRGRSGRSGPRSPPGCSPAPPPGAPPRLPRSGTACGLASLRPRRPLAAPAALRLPPRSAPGSRRFALVALRPLGARLWALRGPAGASPPPALRASGRLGSSPGGQGASASLRPLRVASPPGACAAATAAAARAAPAALRLRPVPSWPSRWSVVSPLRPPAPPPPLGAPGSPRLVFPAGYCPGGNLLRWFCDRLFPGQPLGLRPPAAGSGRRFPAQVTFPKIVNLISAKIAGGLFWLARCCAVCLLRVDKAATACPLRHRPNATKPLSFCCVHSI